MGEETNNTAQQIGEVLASFEPQSTNASPATETEQQAEQQLTEQPVEQGNAPPPDPVAELNARILDLEQKLATATAAPAARTTDEPPADAWADQDFVPEDFDVDRLDRAGLNKLLNAVAAKVHKDSQEGAVKRVLTTVPNIVKNSVATHSAINKAVEKFYGANEELMPHAKQVAFIAEQLLAGSPELGNNIDELFKKAGDEARKRLGIKPGQKPTANRGGLTVVQGQNASPAQALQGVAAEIDAMDKVINK